MGLIALEGMRFHAYHGVYDAERILGTEYVVDIYVQTVATIVAAATDDVSKTVNYESIYQICRIEMEQPRNLIEAVAKSIMAKMKHQFDNMMSLKVRVKKCNPPMGGRIASASIEEEEMYLSACPSCQKQFINYNPGDCWARNPNVFSATKEQLERQYGGKCLCDTCLKLYTGKSS
jgi:7,8-dihydroneopterin aldolase/epimerase/oxygenase